MSVSTETAGLRIEGLLEFFQMDLTPYGGGFYRVVNSINNGNQTSITFLSQTWISLPFITEGFEYDGGGATPQPTITLPDFDGTIAAAAQQYNDLLGVEIKRYLSTKAAVVSNSYYGPEIWLINQKEEADGFKIRFNLATKFTQRNRFIPGRLMTRDLFPALGINKWR